MRIESLTFLRFIAAIIVVIFHFGQKTDLANFGYPLLISGPQMVTYFFALSGFVLVVSHYNKANVKLSDYYVSRIARIAPVYLFALGIYMLLRSAKTIPFILSVTFTQAWIPPFSRTLNTPSWAVSVEMFFYLTFPLIIFFIKKYEIKTISLITFSLIIYFITQLALSNLMGSVFYKDRPYFSWGLINYFPLSHYCTFLLGVSGGVFYMRNIKLFNSEGLVQLVVFFVGIFSTYYFLTNPDVLLDFIGYPLAYKSSFYSPLFIVMILSIACSKNLVTRILALPFLVFLGEISYSLYIIQYPLMIFYRKYISGYFDLGVNNNFYIFLIILVILSSLVFLFIEKPSKIIILKFSAFISRALSNKSMKRAANAAED